MKARRINFTVKKEDRFGKGRKSTDCGDACVCGTCSGGGPDCDASDACGD